MLAIADITPFTAYLCNTGHCKYLSFSLHEIQYILQYFSFVPFSSFSPLSLKSYMVQSIMAPSSSLSEIFSSKTEPLVPHIFYTLIPLKLDLDNFLAWHQQVTATLRSMDLLHFLDRSCIPSCLIAADGDSPTFVNPKYLTYDRQDQSVIAWLLASMTFGILTQMVGLNSSHQVWSKHQTHYASQTRAQIKKHKQLVCKPKKDQSVSTFLLDIKKTVDNLPVVGCPISTKDHIEAHLDGLSDEYEPYVTSVTSRLDPYTVEDIEVLLLAQEGRI